MPADRIEPFAALIFNRAHCGNLREVVAPPYDLIDSTMQEWLYARSPYNVVRLELNRDPDPYTSAAETLALWRRDGIVESLVQPALYFYTQRFRLDGRVRVRNGLIVRIRLEEFGRGILPHERTFARAKADRLRLLDATRTNISSIFGLYSSGDSELQRLLAEVAGRHPLIAVTDDLHIGNEIRAIGAPDEVSIVQRALASTPVLIADGHHRYETALEYRRRTRAAQNPAASMPCDYVMMTLVAFDDPGLVILPTHRLVRHLPSDALAAFADRAQRNFEVDKFDDTAAMRAALPSRGRGALGVALKGLAGARILRLRDPGALQSALPDTPREVRELDVSILHALVLSGIFGISAEAVGKGDNLEYTIDAAAALAEVASGAADGAFLMNPPTVMDVERVCNSGAVMPEKSTYFYPKLLTGLVMNPLE